MSNVLVWDLETIPDLPCVARVHGCDEADEAAARTALGDKFPKLPFHRVACIGALNAERVEGVWQVRSLGAPHMGERSEAELLRTFVDRIEKFRPQGADVQRIEFRPSCLALPGDDQPGQRTGA
jgi:hypothetical protein